MIKKLLVVSLAALGIGLNGCLTDPEESSAPKITLGDIGTLTAGSGVAKQVTGEITADEAIVGEPSVEIVNSKGQIISPTVISRSLVVSESDKREKSEKITVTLQALSGALTDTYTLKITATAGTSGTTNFSFNVQGQGTVTPDLTTKEVTLGAHDNATSGSSIDLDLGLVMFSKDAKVANSGVDIVYTFSEKLNKPVILNPEYAKTSSGIKAFEEWVGPNATQFHIVPAGSFESTTTAADIQKLFDATKVGNGRVEVAENSVLVVKTDKGAYILVKINTILSGVKGTATIKYAK